jgi:indole-3-glycerol phosphate synthase
MSASLREIVHHKEIEVRKSKQTTPAESLRAVAIRGESTFAQALSGFGQHFIAEIKPKSPSSGVLRGELQLDAVVQAYNKHASAISVLTDKQFFGGSWELLKEVRGLSRLPILCKDFILDSYQCLQARSAGADAVLLIVKILDDQKLAELYRTIVELGMTAVVEIQNENELARSLALKPEVLLINNRNLDTFVIDLTTTLRLAKLIPDPISIIAASGIETAQDIAQFSGVCSNFLIGSALMKAANVEEKFVELKGNSQMKTSPTAPKSTK